MKLLVIGSHRWSPWDDAVIADGIAMVFEGEDEKQVFHMARDTSFERAVHRQISDNKWEEILVKPNALERAVGMVDGCLVFKKVPASAALEQMASAIGARVPVIEFTA